MNERYPYRVDEIDAETGRFVRSVNAYTSRLRAEKAADKLNAESAFSRTHKEYIVCKA